MDALIVRSAIAEILLLEGEHMVSDNEPFQQIGVTSLDFIDLCFALQCKSGIDLDPKDLWPIVAMSTDPALHDGKNWTHVGWANVKGLLALADDVTPADPAELSRYLTPAFCARRIEALVSERQNA